MTATAAQHIPPTRERNLILASLLLLAAAAWGVLGWQWAAAGGDAAGLTMGMAAPLFVAVWIVMMVAVMFPTAAPMALMFGRVQATRRQRGQRFVPVWLFVGAYLAVWTLFGVGAYVAAAGAEALAGRAVWLVDNAPRIGGLVLVAAGLYQLTPLKRRCLSKCRTPMDFVMSSWREGRAGAVRMGVEHGLYCLGCCWMLFVLLFPLGVMNVGVMAMITLLIFAEKSLRVGRQVATAAAAGLIAYGAVVAVTAAGLPTTLMGR